MIKLIDILNEAKQVGKLYHFTSLDNLESIKKHGLKFIKDNLSFFDPKSKYNHVLYSISTTRDKSGDVPAAWGKAQVRITLDGDKISNNYKILPVNASNIWSPGTIDSSKEGGWAEERIVSKTPGFLSPDYILDIEELDTFFNFDESYDLQKGIHDSVKPRILNENVKRINLSFIDPNKFLEIWRKHDNAIIPTSEYFENKGIESEVDSEDLDDPDSYSFGTLADDLEQAGIELIPLYNLGIGAVKTGPTGETSFPLEEDVYDLGDGYYVLTEDYTDSFAIMKKKGFEALLKDLLAFKEKSKGGDLSAITGFSQNEGIHDPVKPGILKKRLGKLSCSRVRSAKSKLKDKGTHYAKALQRYLNYHC